MPVMPRMNKKARKIFFEIMGKPQVFKKQTPEEKRRAKIILYKDTTLSK